MAGLYDSVELDGKNLIDEILAELPLMHMQAKHFGPSPLLQQMLIKTFLGSMNVSQSFCLIVIHLNDGWTLPLISGLQSLPK